MSRVVWIVVNFLPLSSLPTASSPTFPFSSFDIDKEPVIGVTIYSDGLVSFCFTDKVFLSPETTEDAAPPVDCALIVILPLVVSVSKVTPLPATMLVTILPSSIFKPVPTFTS